MHAHMLCVYVDVDNVEIQADCVHVYGGVCVGNKECGLHRVCNGVPSPC